MKLHHHAEHSTLIVVSGVGPHLKSFTRVISLRFAIELTNIINKKCVSTYSSIMLSSSEYHVHKLATVNVTSAHHGGNSDSRLVSLHIFSFLVALLSIICPS
jgi:hypothetical protein